MRGLPSVLVTTALALGASLAISPAGGAAQVTGVSAPGGSPGISEAQSTEVAKLTVDPDLRDQRRLSVIFRRPGLLGADGQLQWLLGSQDSARRAAPLVVVSTDPISNASDLSVLEGSMETRHRWKESRSGTLIGVSAAEGGNWFIDRPADQPPARDALVRFDDRFRVVERRFAPSGVHFTSMIPTTRGVVGVGVETRFAKGLKGIQDGVRMTKPVLVAGGRVLRQRLLPEVHAAAALADGSVLITGPSSAGGADPILVVRPDGTIIRPADRRGRNVPESSGRAGVVSTQFGVVMDESSSPYPGPNSVDDAKSSLLLRGKDGRVIVRRKLADLDYPRPAGCAIREEHRRLTSIGVGPDGLPLIRLTCSAPRAPQPNESSSLAMYGDVGTTMLGLTADLRPRWYRRADSDMQPLYVGLNPPLTVCASDSTGVDGRLLTVACDGRVTATNVPNALPVGRGRVVAKRRATGRDALVRIACRGPQGAMCAGRVQISVGGRLRGTADYVVPARPGKAGGTVDRHIDTPSALPARFEARLTAPR